MNYLKIYFQLLAKTSDRVYKKGEHDVHHIIPVYVGGPDHLINIAFLTPREHKIAHRLLRRVMPSRSHDPIIPVEGESRVRTMIRIKKELKKTDTTPKVRKKHKKQEPKSKRPMTSTERSRKHREMKRMEQKKKDSGD